MAGGLAGECVGMKCIQTVAIRVDASLMIGTGHVVRCLTLADTLRSRGVRCHFVCREHPGHMINAIRERGFEVTTLPAGASGFQPAPGADVPLPAHAGWLDCDWQTDAEQTLRAAEVIKPDLLVVDHYALDFRWENVLRSTVPSIMAVDDLADRRHACDFLLDQNWFVGDMRSRYQGLVPERCLLMLGPALALLKPEYAVLRSLMPPRDGEIRRVLVFMGGSDPADTTSKVMEALDQPDLVHLIVDLVLGLNHPDPEGLTRRMAARQSTHVHRGLPSLAGWMARADLMISAGGSTSWERMCLGLPAIVISIADNQTATSAAMAEAGYIDFLGGCADVDIDAIAEAVRRCMESPSRLTKMSHMAQDLVPGTGAQRVCDFLLG